MRHPLTLSTLLFSLCLSAGEAATAEETHEKSFGKSYVHLESDILTLGNDRIARRFRWNDGNLISLDIRDIKRNILWTSSSDQPDLTFLNDSLALGQATVTSQAVARDDVREAHLRVSIKAKSNGFESGKVCRIYDNTPAIACYNNFRKTGAVEANTYDKQAPLYHEGLPFFNRHVQVRAIKFKANTDKNDTLVFSTATMPYHNKVQQLAGNILTVRDAALGGQLFVIKESPPTEDQLHYPGYDYLVDTNTIKVAGNHIALADLAGGQWRVSYPLVVGVAGAEELSVLKAIRSYQDSARRFVAERDDMIVMNTWGDRSQDGKIDEAFVLAELEAAERLGVTHLQLDDGWQAGLSKNSVDENGSQWKSWEQGAWLPHPERLPNGLGPIAKKARELGVGLGIWFNPGRVNDDANWQRNKTILIDLYKKFGVTVFKIDGTNITTPQAEEHLRKLLKEVRAASDNKAVFNLDATADVRPGYMYFYEYSNIFLENRYTDWGNYYPYRTLRNLWMLSRYMPAQRLQVEFLNVWRNEDKYPAADGIRPKDAGFDYAFATTMAGQPLAWFEASSLPDEAFKSVDLIKGYVALQGKFHSGKIFPIGQEPSGYGWTGFQSIVNNNGGYLLAFRENNQQACQRIATWLPASTSVTFSHKLGDGSSFTATTDDSGKLVICLPNANSFALYQYSHE